MSDKLPRLSQPRLQRLYIESSFLPLLMTLRKQLRTIRLE